MSGNGQIPHSKIIQFAHYYGINDIEQFHDIINEIDHIVVKHAQELQKKRSEKVEL